MVPQKLTTAEQEKEKGVGPGQGTNGGKGREKLVN